MSLLEDWLSPQQKTLGHSQGRLYPCLPVSQNCLLEPFSGFAGKEAALFLSGEKFNFAVA
jgi:hypothetical protein